MTDFKAKPHQIRFRTSYIVHRTSPRPRWGTLPPSCIWGAASGQVEGCWGRGGEGEGRGSGGEGKVEPQVTVGPGPLRALLRHCAGRPKFNQLEMITTFTHRPSLVKIDARNFELSW